MSPKLPEADAGYSNQVLAREALLIRPAAFGFNPETASTNAFQQAGVGDDALREFDGVVEALDQAGVTLHVFDDTPDPPKTDAIFPNNWVSFHPEGAVLYPMMAPSRRLERRMDILQKLGKPVILDLSHHEEEGRFLEGTGSLVLEREDRFAFACVSPRTDRMLAFQWCQKMGYRLIDFETQGPDGRAVYHTNVVGSVGEGVAVVCADAIMDQALLSIFTRLEDWIVLNLTMDQMGQFCGNILHLTGSKGPLWAMSERARSAFTPDQIRVLELHGSIVTCPIPTIERLGGGSVRCMICEVF